VAFASSDSTTLWFDVAPGGHYRLESFADAENGQWGIGIVDAASGKRVDRLWSSHPAAATH
jgi:hypothetical protein